MGISGVDRHLDLPRLLPGEHGGPHQAWHAGRDHPDELSVPAHHPARTEHRLGHLPRRRQQRSGPAAQGQADLRVDSTGAAHPGAGEPRDDSRGCGASRRYHRLRAGSDRHCRSDNGRFAGRCANAAPADPRAWWARRSGNSAGRCCSMRCSASPRWSVRSISGYQPPPPPPPPPPPEEPPPEKPDEEALGVGSEAVKLLDISPARPPRVEPMSSTWKPRRPRYQPGP